MKSKRIPLITLFIAIVFFCALPALVIFFADPCQIFHRPLQNFLAHGFSGNARCQNAGFINTYLQDPQEGFDTILSGSSLSGNFEARYINEKLHRNRALKLSLPGITPLEQKITVLHALSTQKINRVILEIFPFQHLIQQDETWEKLQKNNTFPLYLYNSGRIDDYRYIFNKESLQALIGIIKHQDYYNVKNIDDYGFWEHQCKTEKTCVPFHDKEKIITLREDFKKANFVMLSEQEIKQIDFSVADRHLLSTLEPYCNQPNIQFDLFFPPLSFLWYTRQTQQQFDYQLYFLRYIVDKTRHCNNIKVYAFNNEQWISGDLAHYHDPRHFYGGVHRYIIDSIAENKHQITPSNITAFEKQFIDNVNNYSPWASTAEELARSPY